MWGRESHLFDLFSSIAIHGLLKYVINNYRLNLAQEVVEGDFEAMMIFQALAL
jgi:uncharacterized membrane protein YvlD (DUF360 family)